MPAPNVSVPYLLGLEMEVTFTAKGYQPGAVLARYVRANVKGGDYSWCEVGDDRRYDLRQGLVADDIRVAADKLRGTWPGYVDWPYL